MNLWEMLAGQPLIVAIVIVFAIIAVIAVIALCRRDDYEDTKNEDGLWGTTRED